MYCIQYTALRDAQRLAYKFNRCEVRNNTGGKRNRFLTFPKQIPGINFRKTHPIT